MNRFSAEEILENPQALATIWADEDVLADFGAYLLEREAYEKLRGLIFSWVGCVRDVRCLLRRVDDEAVVRFLDDFVLHRAARVEVIAALVASTATSSLFPQHSAWIGHAIFIRGSSLLNSHPAKQYEVAELVPLGVDADRASSRALLSSALEAGRLTAAAVAEVERMFPGDPSRPRRSGAPG